MQNENILLLDATTRRIILMLRSAVTQGAEAANCNDQKKASG
jgi:hypothetical protein